MNRPMLVLMALVVSALAQAPVSSAEDSSGAKAGNAIKHAAGKAGEVIETVIDRTGAGVKKGAKRVGTVAKRGAEKTGEVVETTVKRTEAGVKNGAKKVGAAVTPAASAK